MSSALRAKNGTVSTTQTVCARFEIVHAEIMSLRTSHRQHYILSDSRAKYFAGV